MLPAEQSMPEATHHDLSLTTKRAGASAPAPILRAKTPSIGAISEAEANPDSDLVAIGIDVEIVGVGAIGIFEPRIAIVRIAIFDLGISVAADCLLDPRAGAPAIKVELLAGRGGTPRCLPILQGVQERFHSL